MSIINLMTRVTKFLISLMLILSWVWGVLAIYSMGTFNPSVVWALCLLLTILVLGAVIGVWRAKKLVIGMYVLSLLAIIGWFFAHTPSNHRLWQKDVAVLPYAVVNQTFITIHNVRNFTYNSEFDYVPAYYTKTYDIQKLQGVDLIAVYWMGPKIAHVFLSFDFGGNDHLAISIEARKEQTEGYSTLKGFFRQYELFYVVADERDVIGLRTNYRQNPPEDVYVYKTKGKAGDATRLLLKYIEQINALKEKPQFYNSLMTNCTTTIWLNSLVNTYSLPFSWKVLVSGYVPQYLYENGRLQTDGMTFDRLQSAAWINQKARTSGIAEDFSSKIRDKNAL